MKEKSIYPSLLPYLRLERGKVCLRFLETDIDTFAENSPPFLQVNGSDPLAQIYRAAFVTDYGSVIKEVELLVQREVVKWPAGQKIAMTNARVDQCWQLAMATRRARAPDQGNLLAMQVGDQGQLLPFAPLFYCHTRKVFFEPPCPNCGHALQLCKDDALLKASGLHSYGTGMRRYLHCSSCQPANENQVWYTLERTSKDPLEVRDSKQLIQDFGKIAQYAGQDTFPCQTCEQHDLCHGAQMNAYRVISFLSFYPFYLLITERLSQEGFHLLAMLQETLPIQTGKEGPTIDSAPKDQTNEKEKRPDHDTAIYSILHNLAQEWQREGTQQPEKHQVPSFHKTSTSQQPFADPATPPADDKSLESTLPIENKTRQNDWSKETVIITNPETAPQKDTPNQTDTIVITGNSDSLKLPDRSQMSERPIADTPTTHDDDLTETVILKPGNKP